MKYNISLSDNVVFYIKLIMPIIMPFVCYGFYIAFFNNIYITGIICIGGIIEWAKDFMSYKKVNFVDGELHVTNFMKKHVIPLDTIKYIDIGNKSVIYIKDKKLWNGKIKFYTKREELGLGVDENVKNVLKRLEKET